VECTAPKNNGEIEPHLLMTPPCACPKCAPDRDYSDEEEVGWLRVSGLQQRLKVETLELGETGESLLG
jgi:hypothetical protein